MPKHIAFLDTYAEGGPLPDPATLPAGYPLVIGGLLNIVDATQQGFDPVAGAGGVVLAVTAAHTMDGDATFDHVVTADATTAAFSVTLPASPRTGRVVEIKKVDSSANVVTVATPAAETIDGAASHSLAAQWESVKLVYNGTNWLIYSRDTDTDNQTAAQVPFTPAGGIAATDVQAALVELDGEKARVAPTVNTVAATGAAEDIAFTTAVHDLTMDANCTFSFSGAPASGEAGAITVIVRGAFTPTWPASVDWPSATQPTYAAPTVYRFLTVDGGTTILGFADGLGMG